MVFTLQKEVVQRMTAAVGDKEYGSFSILCQFNMEARNHGTISSGAFYPAPEVSSAIVSLTPGAQALTATDAARRQREGRILDIVLRTLFASRRKTINNNIGKLQPVEGLSSDILRSSIEECGFELSRRAETLSPSDYRAIVDAVLKNIPTD
jgi:16S rRNA (adenine1518-N6/adenine1519-N6)-dimethyltransferase